MSSTSLVTSIILISILLAGCGTPVEEPTPTALPTDTLVPTEPPSPTDTTEPTPEPTTAPIAITTFEELAGKWYKKDRGDEFSLFVGEDGGASRAQPGGVVNLKIWFEDGLFYAGDDPYCEADQLGTYEVSGVPGEYLIFTVVDDPCAGDRVFRGKWIDISLR